MKADGETHFPPNYTRRMIWVFAGQLILVVALLSWNDIFPIWLNWGIGVSVVLFPPMAYLTVLVRPSVRHAWHDLLSDSWLLIGSITRAFFRLFRPSSLMKLARFVASLKPMPDTADGWVTLCVLPFKTCVVATFPLIWVAAKIVSHRAYHHPFGRTVELPVNLLLECYLFSLLGLLLGALLQTIFAGQGAPRRPCVSSCRVWLSCFSWRCIRAQYESDEIRKTFSCLSCVSRLNLPGDDPIPRFAAARP
jgi:hypothetical protein